jgi:phosphoadenosine phosphosulfate reductase
MNPSLVDILSPRIKPLDLDHRLLLIREFIPGRIIFTTSFGVEDQLITHSIFTQALDIEIATIDTGRLFPETYELWERTEARYAQRIPAVYAQTTPLEALIAQQGVNGFYKSLDARKACCAIRKVEPLKRLLDGASAWVTGLRADQSQSRADTTFVAYDSGHKIIKINPLIDYTRDRIVAQTKEFAIPVNTLHDKGFISIGCAPCTRAIAPGENERAGRWWWEQDEKKECGLHVDAEGRLSRAPSGQESSP